MLLAMSASDLLMVIVFVVQACIHLTHRLCGVFQGALFLAVRYLAWRVANFSRVAARVLMGQTQTML